MVHGRALDSISSGPFPVLVTVLYVFFGKLILLQILSPAM